MVKEDTVSKLSYEFEPKVSTRRRLEICLFGSTCSLVMELATSSTFKPTFLGHLAGRPPVLIRHWLPAAPPTTHPTRGSY